MAEKSDQDPRQPSLSERRRDQRERRQAQLVEAMRRNLRRRKAQNAGRTAGAGGSPPSDSLDD